MANTSTRTPRLLFLFQPHRYWPSGWESGPDTLRRDIDRLRGQGYPVEAERGTAASPSIVAVAVDATRMPLFGIAPAGKRTRNINCKRSPTDGVKHMHHPQVLEDHQAHPAQRVCRPQMAAEARDVTADFLTGFHPSATAHTAQDLLVLVSERVTNALRHAGAVTALRLTADRRSIRVTVEDPSPAHPQVRSWRSGQRRRRPRPAHDLPFGPDATIRRRPLGGRTIQVAIPR